MKPRTWKLLGKSLSLIYTSSPDLAITILIFTVNSFRYIKHIIVETKILSLIFFPLQTAEKTVKLFSK